MKNKTILITGAAGFLGSHLSKKLTEENRVIALDVADNLPQDIKKAVKFYQTDITDSKIEEIFQKEKPQIVYHLAGPIALRSEVDNPLFKKSLNILGNLDNVLNCCAQYGVEKIVFFSSGGAIYEKAGIIPTPENYPAHPDSLYGLASLMIEKYLRSYYQKYGLKFTVLRLSNVYGPRQWETGIIPSIMIKLLKGEPPVIYGSGQQTRDFIFIEDIIDAGILALKDDKNETYNISSGRETSINEILNKINAILNKSCQPIYIPKKISETERSCLDNSKIKKELNWQPKYDLEEGLKETINWFKDNGK